MNAMTLVLSAVLAAACASGAAAQPELERARERAAVAACVASAEGTDSDALACIGDVTRACAAAMGDGGETTVGMVACATREREAWEALLQSGAAALRERETPTQLALLDAALAQGEMSAQARCAYAASFYEGGSLARVLGAQCMRDATAERAIELQQRLRDYEQL